MILEKKSREGRLEGNEGRRREGKSRGGGKTVSKGKSSEKKYLRRARAKSVMRPPSFEGGKVEK